jgi:UDP-N-acetylglucosamine acyltransferase
VATEIHPTAIIDPKAELGQGVRIGPYVIVEGGVRIGDQTEVMAHAYLGGPSTIGPECSIHIGAVIGHAAQDKKLAGRGGALVIGARNIFREYVTVHRSNKPAGTTIIGDDNFLLAASHVAHDCVVGNNTVFANSVLLAGHVTVEDRVFISGNVAIHQFVRVGRLVMLGGHSRIVKDVPPFMLVEGNSKVRMYNVVGMRRAGMTHEQIETVKAAFTILYRSGLSVPGAVERLQDLGPSPEIQAILDFIRISKRGICGGVTHKDRDR